MAGLTDKLGQTIVAGDLLLLAGLCRRAEAPNALVVIGDDTLEGLHALRAKGLHVLKLDDIIVRTGAVAFTGVPTCSPAPTLGVHLANRSYVDTLNNNLAIWAVANLQPLDATLTALAALSSSADQVIYATGSDAFAMTTLANYARTVLLQLADAEAARQALEVGNTERHSVRWHDMDVAGSTQAGFNETKSGTGAAISQGWPFINSTNHCLGVMMLEGGTTASGFASMHTWNNVLLCNNGATLSFETRLMVETVATASDDYKLEFGFGNSWNTGAHSDSIVFRYDRATDGNYWQCITRKDGTETKTDTGIEVVASLNAPIIFRIDVNAAGSSVTFDMNDGGGVATHTTNIPANTDKMGFGWFLSQTAYSSVNQRIGIDWVRFVTTRTAAR